MANPEHLEILNQGAEVWNEWREENPFVFPDLNKADMSSIYLIGADLNRAHLMGAHLMGSYLNETNLSRADLRAADLRRADLSRADLRGADLRRADLSETDLRGVDLTGANLGETDLSEAFLGRTNLSEADLKGANLGGVDLSYTLFTRNNLSYTIGLHTCEHRNPSSFDHETLRLSRNLPLSFLRGVGLSDIEIEQYKLYNPDLSNAEVTDIIYKIHDLRVTQSIQVNPLFISYSHANEDFVNALEPLLIDMGIRFWRDKHDMKAGPLEMQVDRAMRLNPTVLLILSEASVNSDWVEHEAASARELEKELGRHVLCPVALDEAWKDAPWEMRLRRQIHKYNILDFSNWKDEKFLKKQFKKLIEGLDLFYKKEE